MTIRIPSPPVDQAMGRLGGVIVLLAVGAWLWFMGTLIINRTMDLVWKKWQVRRLSQRVKERIPSGIAALAKANLFVHDNDPAGFAHPVTKAYALVLAAAWILRFAGATDKGLREGLDRATALALEQIHDAEAATKGSR